MHQSIHSNLTESAQQQASSNMPTTASNQLEEEKEANWLDLPNHLLELIIDKLNLNLFDYIRCGVVCVSWRSMFLDHTPKQFPPLLLIPTPTPDDHHDEMTKSRSFYSISDNKVCDFQVRMPHYRQCRGSGPGSWLIIVDDLKLTSSYSIRLFNPFLSHDEILLPSLETFPHYHHVDSIHSDTYLKKAVLSADPLSNPDGYTVLAIFSEYKRLAFYKSGDKAWTPIRPFRKPDDNNAFSSIKLPSRFHDIIYKGNFLAISYDGELVVCQPERPVCCPEHRWSRRIALGPEKKKEEVEPRKYLVHTSNNVVMQVHRCFEVDHDMVHETFSYSTTGFKVLKLGNVNKWETVKSLGDHALFIGANNCISISTSDYPGALIKTNCIYYLNMEDDPYHSSNDMGVYNLEDGSFEKHYLLPGISSIYPEPIWIQHQPILQKKKQ